MIFHDNPFQTLLKGDTRHDEVSKGKCEVVPVPEHHAMKIGDIAARIIDLGTR
jgi:hypothetical protein